MNEHLDYYRDIIKEFLTSYLDDRITEMRYLGVDVENIPKDVMTTEQANQLLIIAQAAFDPSASRRDEVHDCVQGFLQRLFAMPNEAEYDIPRSFWMTDIGNMVLLAMVWAWDDDLITITQAVEMTGKPHDYFSHAVQRGRLTSYPDKSEPNPTRQTRLLKSEVKALVKKSKATR